MVPDSTIAEARSRSIAQDETKTVTATKAQNQFGNLLDEAARGTVFTITRHNSPRAVLMPFGRYMELVEANARYLAGLSAQFDALYDLMQTDEAKAGFERAFRASPAEIGEAAERASMKRRRR